MKYFSNLFTLLPNLYKSDGDDFLKSSNQLTGFILINRKPVLLSLIPIIQVILMVLLVLQEVYPLLITDYQDVLYDNLFNVKYINQKPDICCFKVSVSKSLSVRYSLPVLFIVDINVA